MLNKSQQLAVDLLKSWKNTDGNVNTTDEILEWIRELNDTTHVVITNQRMSDDGFWFYDDYRGEILNRKRSFFSVIGMRYFVDDEFVSEQPMILQPEIGYLGIIVREIDGVLNFLMQAKIEPGNVNCVQISPTIQATKSNFTRAHGGKLPLYFDLFEHARESGEVLYDQIQSEQGSRFVSKRNRNIIIRIDSDIDIHPNFKWMTLGQIKELLKIDNLVNMDTRTVLSGLPLASFGIFNEFTDAIEPLFTDHTQYASLYTSDPAEYLPILYSNLNDYKMFREIRKMRVPLNDLVDWTIDDYGVSPKLDADYTVRFYDIEIEGREVRRWSQPMFCAASRALFVLFTRVVDGRRLYLLSLRPEIGTLDKAEYGPTIQLSRESAMDDTHTDPINKAYADHMRSGLGILTDVILSEEGGRFYHEQNRNMILELSGSELPEVPPGYVWADLSSIMTLIQAGGYVNIQLRNIISLISI